MKTASRSRWFAGLLLLAALLVWSSWQLHDYLRRPLALAAQQPLIVERGSSLGRVIRELAERRVLERPLLLSLYVRVTGRGRHIQAGEYRLEPGLTPLQLLDVLEQGRVVTRSVTLVEGWTVAQARALLDKAPHLRALLKTVPPQALLARLGIDAQPGRSPEGLFFPDTYVYSSDATDRDILLQAYQRMQAVLAEEWAQRGADLPYHTPYDALIMASIIERETGVPAERSDIAGVFVRRLRRGMLLQTDPAVIYGLGSGFDGNLRRRDLTDRDNPYNTYVHPGLPPTPIALPGRAAIHAALQPEDGDALYFVGKGDGTHAFSATLAEHQRAVKKYQLGGRRADYRSRPPASSH